MTSSERARAQSIARRPELRRLRCFAVPSIGQPWTSAVGVCNGVLSMEIEIPACVITE